MRKSLFAEISSAYKTPIFNEAVLDGIFNHRAPRRGKEAIHPVHLYFFLRGHFDFFFILIFLLEVVGYTLSSKLELRVLCIFGLSICAFLNLRRLLSSWHCCSLSIGFLRCLSSLSQRSVLWFNGAIRQANSDVDCLLYFLLYESWYETTRLILDLFCLRGDVLWPDITVLLLLVLLGAPAVLLYHRTHLPNLLEVCFFLIPIFS